MYQQNFWYRIKEKGMVNGKRVYIVELTPMDKDEEYFKIDLTIDADGMIVVGSRIYTKSGIHYIYSIGDFTPNVQLPEDFFAFDPARYPGIEIVDLR